MKPALNIAELVKQPLFGANKILKITIANLEESAIKNYVLLHGNNVLRVEVLRPNQFVENAPITQFFELERNVNTEQFFRDIEAGTYLVHGQLNAVTFAEDFLIYYTEKLSDKFSYGTDPVLEKVIHIDQRGIVVYFSTVKNGKRRQHQASWQLLDIAEDLNVSVIIPRKLFKTYREFNKLLTEAIGITPERFYLKEDPTETQHETITVFMQPDDLVYSGSLQVAVPYLGEKVRVINLDGDEVVDVEEPAPEVVLDSFVITDANDVVLDGTQPDVEPGTGAVVVRLKVKTTPLDYVAKAPVEYKVLDAGKAEGVTVVVDNKGIFTAVGLATTGPVTYTVEATLDGKVVTAPITINYVATPPAPEPQPEPESQPE